jgi:hypothetical protein
LSFLLLMNLFGTVLLAHNRFLHRHGALPLDYH